MYLSIIDTERYTLPLYLSINEESLPCAFVVETPRLLLNSANGQFLDGLANSSGMVGKSIMVHNSHDVYTKFDYEILL
jgi:choline dehydrogenase-like flavoprotein